MISQSSENRLFAYQFTVPTNPCTSPPSLFSVLLVLCIAALLCFSYSTIFFAPICFAVCSKCAVSCGLTTITTGTEAAQQWAQPCLLGAQSTFPTGSQTSSLHARGELLCKTLFHFHVKVALLCNTLYEAASSV